MGRAFAVVAVVLVVFFAPAVFSSAQFVYQDTGRAFEPLKRYIAHELLQGRFPSWNPYSGLGVPLVSGAIYSVQHPFNLLLLPSFEVGFKLWVLLAYLLAAGGGFVWARSLERSWYASVSAGLAFALSGYLVSLSSNLQFLTAYASLPLLYAMAHGWMRHAVPSRLVLLCAASAFCASAGDPQSWGIAVASLPVYGLMVISDAPGGRRSVFLRGAVALIASVMAAAPFILPVLAWLPHSSRSMPLLPFEYGKWNLHPFRLLELAVANIFRSDPGRIENTLFRTYAGNAWTSYPWALSIYPGVGCLALAVVGAARSRSARWMIAAAVVFLWVALGDHAGFAQIARQLPVIGSFRYWEKMVVWPTLFLAMASAYGFDAAVEDRALARRVALGTGVAALPLLLVAVLLTAAPEMAAAFVRRGGAYAAATGLVSNLSAGFMHAALALAALAATSYSMAQRWRPAASQVVLGCVLIIDIASANRGAYYVSDRLRWQTPPIAAAFTGSEGVQRTLVPFGPKLDRWPGLDEFENESRWWARTVEMPWNVPAHVGNFRPYEGLVQDRMFSYQIETDFTPKVGAGLWGVASIVVPDAPDVAAALQIPPPYRVRGVDAELPAYVVEIPHRPRAYLAERLIDVDERQALRFALEPDAVTSTIVALESPLPRDWSSPHGDVRLVHDEPCRTVWEARSDRRALMVLNDAFAPGWSATVDGRKAEILPANYLARGVWVEAGTHTVTFQYHAPLLLEGWVLFGLGAAAIGVWAVMRERRSGPA